MRSPATARRPSSAAEQQRLVEALDASVRLSRQRYEGGVDNYLQVLDAQRNLFQGELDLARLRQQELASIVQLYRALGRRLDTGTAAVVRRGTHVVRGGRAEGIVMAKRMILMLAVTAAVIAVLGFVKFQQFQAAAAQAAGVPAAARSGHDDRRAAGAVARHAAGHRHDRGGAGRDRQRRSAGPRGPHLVRVRPGGPAGRRARRARYARRSRRSSPRRRRSASWRASTSSACRRSSSTAPSRGPTSTSAAAEQKSTDARVGEIKASIARKTIRAPFSGILGIRQVNLGQYLSGGDPVVPLQSLHPIYVNFGVPQQETARVRVGGRSGSRLTTLSGVEFTGRVTAVDSVVNQETRNVQVQATVPNPDGKLRPGMFVQTADRHRRHAIDRLAAGVRDQLCAVRRLGVRPGRYEGPRRADAIAASRQQFVKLGPSRGDRVAVLSGVNAGDEVVTSGMFKLRNGAAVHVNNAVQPANNASPKLGDS